MIIGFCICLIILIVIRVFYLQKTEIKEEEKIQKGEAYFIGDRQIQADKGVFYSSKAGELAVLADGIGKETLGAVAAKAAVHAFVTLYKGYQVLSNPPYFLKRAFHLANFEVLKIMEGRKGGASVAAAFVTRNVLTYAIAGDIQIALFRKGELIHLTEGQTISSLAGEAYKKGKLTKQKALWAIQEKRLYNYVGQDGFRGIELVDIPVQLNKEDSIILMTKGVYEGLSWREIEDSLKEGVFSAQEQAEKVIDQLAEKKDVQKDNSSILIMTVKK